MSAAAGAWRSSRSSEGPSVKAMTGQDGAIDFDRLRRLRGRHRWMTGLFLASMITAVVGIIGGLATAEAEWPAMLLECAYYCGVTLVGVCVVLSFPFRRQACPRCGKPFCVAEGFLGFLSWVNLSNRNCVHCGLSLDEGCAPGDVGAERTDGADAATPSEDHASGDE